MSRPTLYDIEQRYLQALALFDDPEIPLQAALDTVEALEGELDDKLEACVAFAADRRVLAEACAADAKRQAARAKALHDTADAVEGAALAAMLRHQRLKVETPRFRLTVCNNAESVDIVDLQALPRKYQRKIPASYAPDKQAIKQAIQAGLKVRGAQLVRKQRLQVR